MKVLTNSEPLGAVRPPRGAPLQSNGATAHFPPLLLIGAESTRGETRVLLTRDCIYPAIYRPEWMTAVGGGFIQSTLAITDDQNLVVLSVIARVPVYEILHKQKKFF